MTQHAAIVRVDSSGDVAQNHNDPVVVSVVLDRMHVVRTSTSDGLELEEVVRHCGDGRAQGVRGGKGGRQVL